MATETKIKPPASRKIGVAATQVQPQIVTQEENAEFVRLLGYGKVISNDGKPALAAVLRKLDVAILDPRSVKRYKRERLAAARKARPNSWGFNGRLVWSWESQSLRGYRKAVPLSALRTAARIAAELPGVAFHVEELRRSRMMVDPFLYVTYKGGKYYIAHWDEPSFEG